MSIVTLKKELSEQKPVLGLREVVSLLKKGTVKKVYVSTNLPEKDYLCHLAEVAQVPIENLSLTNKELGTLCKKPFAVGVLCFTQ